MTGFIKPREIMKAQEEIIKLTADNGDYVTDLDKGVREFLKIHPVTKEKEAKPFREVDGVYVTEEAFEKADKLKRPLEDFPEGQ